METLIMLVISILPVYLILKYIYKKDNNKEPYKMLKTLFIYGIIICLPVAFIEIGIEKLFPDEKTMSLSMLFIYVLIDVALIEELFKWIVVYTMSFKHNEFDQIYDAIVYAAFVSLGFACIENVLYVLDSGILVGLARGITAIPGHASDAIIMGNYLGLAKLAEANNNISLKRRNLILSIILPVLTHGIYDYCLFTGNIIFIIGFIIFLIFIYVYSIKKIKRVSSNNHSLINSNYFVNNDIKYCTKCGTKCQGNYCYRCGNKL